MSAPKAPKDNSVELARMDAQRQDAARAQATADAAAKATQLAALRSNAATGARSSADTYFSDQGLVPGDYGADISSVIDSILSGIAPDDPNPGAYFKDVGERAYNQAQGGQRNKASRDFERLFPANFDTARISDTADDPFLSAIEAEQRQGVEAKIKNLLDRHVITQTGYAGAEADLEKQAPGARARLAELGGLELAGGRQKLRDIANEGRSTASNLNLGSSFDPSGYATRTDAAFNDWLGTLGDRLRAKTPGDLFSFTDLVPKAGAAQGGQNTMFDANALAGLADDNPNRTADASPNSIF